jgi:hypothetical protein
MQIYNDAHGTGPAATAIGACAEAQMLVQYDQDYFLQVTPSDGSSGIGAGFLSVRPAFRISSGALLGDRHEHAISLDRLIGKRDLLYSVSLSAPANKLLMQGFR